MTPLQLAWRYFFYPAPTSQLKMIPRAAMLGLALSLTVLITTLSVMNGFEKDIRERILQRSPHLFTYQQVADPTNLHPYLERSVDKAHRFFQTKVLIPNWAYQQVHLFASDSIEQVKLSSYLTSAYPWDGQQIEILGFAKKKAFGQPVFFKKNLIPSEIIQDSIPAIYMPLDEKKDLESLQWIETYGLWLKDPLQVDRLKHSLETHTPYKWISWKEQYSSLFDALASEKRLLSVVLFLLVILIYVQLALTLILIFKEKEKDSIPICFFMRSEQSWSKVLLYYGMINVLAGLFLGCLAGYALSLNLPKLVSALEQITNLRLLSYEQYYTSQFPCDFRFSDLSTVALMTLGIGFLTCYSVLCYTTKQPVVNLLRKHT